MDNLSKVDIIISYCYADAALSRRLVSAAGGSAYGMTPAAEVASIKVIKVFADVAQLVEQDFRKVKVGGSIPLIGF